MRPPDAGFIDLTVHDRPLTERQRLGERRRSRRRLRERTERRARYSSTVFFGVLFFTDDLLPRPRTVAESGKTIARLRRLR